MLIIKNIAIIAIFLITTFFTVDAAASDMTIALSRTFKRIVLAQRESKLNQLKLPGSCETNLELIEVSLVGERIDIWNIIFLYKEKRMVVLQAFFDAKEKIPPQFIVRFPSGMRYVCFEELGFKTWQNHTSHESAIDAAIWSLYEEYKNKACIYHHSLEQKLCEAIGNWKFVQTSHRHWQMIELQNKKYNNHDEEKTLTDQLEEWKCVDGSHRAYLDP